MAARAIQLGVWTFSPCNNRPRRRPPPIHRSFLINFSIFANLTGLENHLGCSIFRYAIWINNCEQVVSTHIRINDLLSVVLALPPGKTAPPSNIPILQLQSQKLLGRNDNDVSALFFVTYDSCKAFLKPKLDEKHHFFIYMGAAAFSEMVACLIRVPVEVTKQRSQALLLNTERLGIRLLYRGYWSTVLRDMPFSLLQFPLWEYFKDIWKVKVNRELEPWEGAVCGAVSGGIAAAATTPLDAAKTRIMLSEVKAGSSELRISTMLRKLYRENGVRGLFAGISPRVAWITVGGFVFFGMYEETKVITTRIFPTTSEPGS